VETIHSYHYVQKCEIKTGGIGCREAAECNVLVDLVLFFVKINNTDIHY